MRFTGISAIPTNSAWRWYFTNEMAQDFRRLGFYQDLPPEQPLLEAEMTENFVKQLQVVLLGASHWKEK